MTGKAFLITRKNCFCPIDNPIVQDLINDKFLYEHYKSKDTYTIKAKTQNL